MALHNNGKRIAFLGVFLALALIVSYVEALLPFDFGIPGVKLGLTNSVVVLLLYLATAREAFLISVVRILLVGLLFGNAVGIFYSLGGGLVSFAVMALLKRAGFSALPVSAAGGVSHNIGQLFVAVCLVSNLYVLYYLPVLLLSGVMTGMLIGVVAQELIVRLSAYRRNHQ